VLRPIVRFIVVLQSNTAPREIAAGVALSLYFGLTPLNHTHVIFLILALFVFKINRAATLVFLPFFKLIYYLGFIYLADAIGYFLLVRCTFLDYFWTAFVHAPILSYLDVQYTLVLGGMTLAMILTLPVYALATKGVRAYRSGYKEKLDNWQIVKLLKGLTLSRWIITRWPKA